MTAEGSTGAPLRQQIAEAIHGTGPCWRGADGTDNCDGGLDHLTAADAVVALLNLTEEVKADEHFFNHTVPAARRWVSPWVNDPTANDAYWQRTVERLPSTPPDTSSSETTT